MFFTSPCSSVTEPGLGGQQRNTFCTFKDSNEKASLGLVYGFSHEILSSLDPNLQKNTDFILIMYKKTFTANIRREKLVAFLINPKVACTSLSQVLKKNGFDKRAKVEIDFDELKFIFTFVRNPWDRLVSRYSHLIRRIHEVSEHDLERPTSPQDRTLKLFFEEKPLSTELFTFEKFVDFSTIVDDPHWLPQTTLLEGCLDKIHFIGKFETLQKDFNIVCDRIDIPRQNLPHSNKSTHKHYTDYYRDETREIVSEKYKKDIEVFGYTFGK